MAIGTPPEPFPEPPRNVRTEWFYAIIIWGKRIVIIPIALFALFLGGYLLILLSNKELYTDVRATREMTVSENSAPVLETAMVFLFMGFVSIIVIRDWWIRPYRLRQLYSFGTVVRGVVLSKRRLRSDRYEVTYSFQDQTGCSHTCQMTSLGQVDRIVLWSQIREGQPVTVLHTSESPPDSTVYELGNYTVE